LNRTCCIESFSLILSNSHLNWSNCCYCNYSSNRLFHDGNRRTSLFFPYCIHTKISYLL
ncbi:hypothetical protein HMP0015_1979, partial [Acinetobacter haemolyticus ATCC 19194]